MSRMTDDEFAEIQGAELFVTHDELKPLFSLLVKAFRAERARVRELDERLTSSRNINSTLVRNFKKTESRLRDLREGLEGLQRFDLGKFGERNPVADGEFARWRDLQSLLEQTK